MSICTDKVYVHVYSEVPKSSPNASVLIGSLFTQYNFSKQCANHLSKETETDMKCASLSDEECFTDGLCDDECQWISCTYGIKTQKTNVFKEFTLCIPSNIYAEDKICYNHYDYFKSPNKRFSFKKCGYPLNSYKLPGKSGITAGIIAIIIILVIIVTFILSIFYYRYSISAKKIVPFTPPKICPEWIYPKMDAEPRKLKPMLRNSYKPPEDEDN